MICCMKNSYWSLRLFLEIQAYSLLFQKLLTFLINLYISLNVTGRKQRTLILYMYYISNHLLILFDAGNTLRLLHMSMGHVLQLRSKS